MPGASHRSTCNCFISSPTSSPILWIRSISQDCASVVAIGMAVQGVSKRSPAGPSAWIRFGTFRVSSKLEVVSPAAPGTPEDAEPITFPSPFLLSVPTQSSAISSTVSCAVSSSRVALPAFTSSNVRTSSFLLSISVLRITSYSTSSFLKFSAWSIILNGIAGTPKSNSISKIGIIWWSSLTAIVSRIRRFSWSVVTCSSRSMTATASVLRELFPTRIVYSPSSITQAASYASKDAISVVANVIVTTSFSPGASNLVLANPASSCVGFSMIPSGAE